MAKTKQTLQKKIMESSLKLAAREGWAHLTLEAIAKSSKVSLSEVKKHFSDKTDILIGLTEMIDDAVKASLGRTDKEASHRDRLFEVMMARIDVLQNNRAAFLGILNDLRRDLNTEARLVPSQIAAMQKMLHLAGLKSEGLKGRLSLFGLLTIYGITLHIWQRDETKDMAKTMAILDRQLHRASQLTELIFPSKSR